MRKFYTSPDMECVTLSVADLITASSLSASEDSETNGKYGEVNAIYGALDI